MAARPVALAVSFAGSGLGLREQAAAMWFGPKGFSSVVYGLLVLDSGITAADDVFHLVALNLVISILAHSSTDIVVARAFDESREAPAWHGVLHRLHRCGTACCTGYTGRGAEMIRADRTLPRVGDPPWNVNREPAGMGHCRNHRRQQRRLIG